MASSTQVHPGIDTLPGVELHVRQGGGRAAVFAVDGVDFLIGGVPGCDLRVAAEGAGVLCLIARHPGGASLRKLAPTLAIQVNGQAVSNHELADGDHVKLGALEIDVRISPALAASGGAETLERGRLEFQQAVTQLRHKVVLFEKEKAEFDRARQVPPPGQPQREELLKELETRKLQLEERALEIDRQNTELARVRGEMADQRRLLHDHLAERRDKLTTLQDDIERSRRELDERVRKMELDQQDAADRRHHDRQRQEELEKKAAELQERSQRFDEERKLYEQRQQDALTDAEARNAEMARREAVLADQSRDVAAKIKQYEGDVLRLHRLETGLEDRRAELDKQTAEQTGKREQLERDSAELEEQLRQLDEWRAQLLDEAERLGKQKQEQETLTRELADRSASFEGQQSSLTVLRGRIERMRDEVRTREQQLDQQSEALDARQAGIARAEQALEQRKRDMEADQQQYEADRRQWLERSAVIESAVSKIKQAQQRCEQEDARLRKEREELEARGLQQGDAEAVLQSRLEQVAQTQERVELDRQSLQKRSVNLVEREQACVELQEQLQRRSAEIAAKHKESADRLQEYQTKFTELEERRKALEDRDQSWQAQTAAWRQELEQKAQSLEKQQLEAATFDDRQREQLNLLAVQRKTLSEERAHLHLEQQAALDKLKDERTALEKARQKALELIAQLPDAELRAGVAVDRLGHAREQLRHHLGEIHQYVRQCQEELEQLRGRLQSDLDKLQAEETSLRRDQDEHRLAVVAFRQQLIDWQGQIADLRRLLSRDETRLERRQAKVDKQARGLEAESQRLAQHAEALELQQRDVAERRQEMDRHLVDMQEWYRHKLRELAGIPLVPVNLSADTEPTILQAPVPLTFSVDTGAESLIPHVPEPAASPEDESADLAPGIVPTGRSILSMTSHADPGDQKLGGVLRDLQLIDGDSLTALLAEARRQRRSLRQVLLASGVITLYQLALIEAGNVGGLVLGPVRIIDRLRHNAHESVYRVFDPRRGAEAVLRHLAETDMAEFGRPDEFRQSFERAKLNDPHLANTLEVLELGGRPAVLQEWLVGLPASDWPPLAAAPGVCQRLLTQAAQGLTVTHTAGVVHGHLADGLLMLTGDGVLKICGLGEPAWLIGLTREEEPTPGYDLRALGRIASGWCAPSAVRKGPKTKPLPEALVTILYRLAAEHGAGYRDAQELLSELHQASASIPPNAEAWERLLKYVRDHGAAEAVLRQSA